MFAGFFSNTTTNCGDIRVTQSDGTTEVPREIVSCDNSGGTGELHFKAPSISSSADADFYIYYGNSGASNYTQSDTYGPENVWTNAYEAVWHMQEGQSGTGNTGIYTDSTSNNNDGDDYASATGDAGKVGGGQEFDGSDDYVQIPPSINSDLSKSITFSAWIRPETTDETQVIGIIDSGSNYSAYKLFRLRSSYKNWKLLEDDESTSHGVNFNNQPPVDTWSHMVGTYDYDGGRMNLYLNGSVNATTNTGTFSYKQVDKPGNIGRDPRDVRPAQGEIDEVRIADTDRSDSWISAEYTNQNTPTTFYTVSSQETQTFAPTVTTNTTSNVATSSATADGEITDTGGENADERGFVYDTTSQSDPGNTTPGSSSYSSSVTETGSFGTGSFTGSLTGLSENTTYYVRAYAHNSAGYSYGSEVSFTTKTAGGGTISTSSTQIRGDSTIRGGTTIR